MRRTISRSCAVAGLVLVGVVLGQSGVAPEARQTRAAQPASEWRTYGADLASTRYSALDQINNGKQYIVVAVSGVDGARLIAYALP